MAEIADDQHSTVLGRLEREREQAERRYVAALAALDAASGLPPALSDSLAGVEADIARVGRAWGASRGGGVLGRLRLELNRLLPWRRRALNGAMVAALHRQADATRALADATRHFHSHVIWYGQTIATFAKSQRQGAGTQGSEVVHAALNAIATDWQLRWDSLQARELRYEGRTTALTKAYEDLRDVVSLAQQSTTSLKRAVEELRTTAPGAAPSSHPGGTPPEPTTGVDTNAFKYVAFEDRFRGSREEIRSRLTDYLPLFSGAQNVVDMGCGRGELLDLFRENGIGARGIDVNDEMVEACRARGLTADRSDAVSFLLAQADASLGGVIAIQVVEHLEPPYLMRLIETAFHKLKPGGTLVLETINAACWSAFFDSYIRDFTHVRPIHPDTLRYLVQASGFPNAEIRFRAPIAEHDKLPSVKLPTTDDGANSVLVDLADAVNAHAQRLNSQLFTYRDFAVVARR